MMPLNILVVDDDTDSASTLAFLLLADGHAAQFASSVDDALAMLLQVTPHCILFDMEMPNKNGLILAREVRRLLMDSVCLICITGMSMTSSKVVEMMDFADYVLPKPVDYYWLRNLLPSVFETGDPPDGH